MSEVKKLQAELRYLAGMLVAQLEWAEQLFGLNAKGRATLRRARRCAAKQEGGDGDE